MNLCDFTGERAVSNVDNRANLHGVRKSSVGAGNAGVVTFDGVVGDNLQRLACNELNWLVIDEEACADLRALSIEHDGARLVGTLLKGLTKVRNRLTMSLQTEQRM